MEVLWQPGMSLSDVEKMVIQKSYSFYQKNKTQTAHCLGIAIRTLDSKLEKYGIEKVEVKKDPDIKPNKEKPKLPKGVFKDMKARA